LPTFFSHFFSNFFFKIFSVKKFWKNHYHVPQKQFWKKCKKTKNSAKMKKEVSLFLIVFLHWALSKLLNFHRIKNWLFYIKFEICIKLKYLVLHFQMKTKSCCKSTKLVITFGWVFPQEKFQRKMIIKKNQNFDGKTFWRLPDIKYCCAILFWYYKKYLHILERVQPTKAHFFKPRQKFKRKKNGNRHTILYLIFCGILYDCVKIIKKLFETILI